MATGIYRRGSVYWIPYTGLDGRQKRESSNSERFKDAELLLSQRKQTIGEGKEPEIKKIKNYTFEELAIKYFQWCQRQRSFSSKRIFIKQLVDTFGHLQLRQINTMLVEQFQNRPNNQGQKTCNC